MPSLPIERHLSSANAAWIVFFLAVFAASCAPSRPSRKMVENAAYRLTVSAASDGLRAVLEDKRSGLRLADGPLVYRTDTAGHENPATLSQLLDPAVIVESHRLIIRGTLAGLRVEHAPPMLLEAGIRGDPVQPGGEAALAPEIRQILHHAQGGLLRQVFGHAGDFLIGQVAQVAALVTEVVENAALETLA